MGAGDARAGALGEAGRAAWPSGCQEGQEDGRPHVGTQVEHRACSEDWGAACPVRGAEGPAVASDPQLSPQAAPARAQAPEPAVELLPRRQGSRV